MVRSCASSVIKVVIFGVNALLALFGLGTLGFGTWAVLDDNASKVIKWDFNVSTAYNATMGLTSKNSSDIVMYTLIVVGALVFIVSFFGCCGALMENRLALGIYFLCIFVLFIVAAVAAALAIFVVSGGTAKTEVGYMMGNTTDSALTEIQTQFKCCGDGFEGVPRASVVCISSESTGCASAVYDMLRLGGLGIGVIALCMVCMMAIVLCFVCCLIMGITQDKRSVNLY